METNSELSTLQNDDDSVGSQGIKRKRNDSKKSSNDECSDTEPSQTSSKQDDLQQSTVVTISETKNGASKSATRKRKFVFNENAPSKIRRFYFLNQQVTKPRKPKLVKSKEKEDEKVEISAMGKKHKLHFAKVDSSGNVFLMHRLHSKSDLFFNDEKKYNYEAFKKLDLAFHVVDEIALEGLDGITVEAFWKRLKNVFPNNMNKAMADRIWRIICNNKRINFYILKEAREELVSFDRCKYLDIDSGMFVEPFIEFKDIYPMASVNGTEIRGSCSTFDTRKENNGVRKFSMEKALKLYDQKLVFVADQTLRNKALINEEADPNIELLDVEYCMLEKIGRSREQGELTQGKMSLVNDTKKLYHNRKALAQHFLIVPQSFSLKSLPSQQNISGGLVQLKRFYHKRKTKQIAIMERIAQILKMRPNFQIEFTEFRKIFGRNVCIVKLAKTPEFRKFFKLYNVPYRKLYPNATKQEYLHKNKTMERQVKILRMVDPCANVTVLMDGKDAKESPREKTGCSPGNKLINYEYLRDIFLYILSSGPVGVTIQEIHDYFKTDFYSVRMAVRKLLLRNVINTNKIDLGRQQSLKFYAKCFSIPGCHINTQPKVYKLSEETISRALKGYKVQDFSSEYSSKPVTPPQTISVPIQFTLKFEPFCCTSFLTETVDSYSEELTIYDIVNKGRDKLLLIGSNLFAHYISEWDGFLLKREDFSKDIQLFQYGFGKVVYDFLKTIRIDAGLQTDNLIIFDVDNITPDTKIVRQFNSHRVISIAKNYSSPHSDSCYIDIIAKVYVFEAMFNECHKNNTCIEHLKDIFERIMISDGKKKRSTGDVNKPDIKLEVEVSSNVVMEKFMGPNPVLEFTTQEEEITVNIYASTKPENVLDIGTMFNADDVNQTQRYMNRANLILKTVYEHKIVQDVQTLYKDVLKEEDEEGYDKKACKKSIVSIITKLVMEGYIKCYKVVMTGKNTTRTQSFICVHDIDCHHSLIKSTIEQLKLKFYVGVPNTQKTITIKKKSESPFSSNDVRQSITELKQLTTFKAEVSLKPDRMKGRSYGYAPKFERMRVLHELLFFVIHEISESEPLSPRQIFELCKGLKIRVSQSDITEMPPVYRNEVSWKMFIPPLPKHNNWPPGWALACDIVLRMPLSIFVKLYNLTYEVPELETYLNHPIKKHYLVKYLPVETRNILLYRRKYFHSIYETICNLCYIGLLQLGPRSFKEKDQLFLYLNSKATLYDTCSSKPGYNVVEDKKYKKIPIEFKSASDVEIYWSEMLRICLNTPLGKRKILDGQYVTIEECASKSAMVATLKAKTFDEAVKNDNGKIPGDRKGSAGFDSSLWSYVKRNWVWNSQMDNKTIQSEPGVKKEVFDITIPEPIQYDLIAKGGPPECKVYLKKKTKKPPKLSAVKKLSRKKFVRKIVAPRKKKVREYFDALDRSIMKKNSGMRVDWSEEEDQLLRYARIASLFLCPIFKKQFIPYNILRDVLHRIHPKSKNKTARAIQRRIYVLLTNDETLKIMETNIENLLNSEIISKYFGQIRARYKNSVKLSDPHIHIAFIYLISYIYRHKKEVELLLLGFFTSFDFFSDANIAEFETLLQTCDDTNSDIYKNPKSVEDITTDTIKSVIHCSMACRRNSIGWTYHLSRICKKFHDESIRSTLHALRKDQFFVHNKNSETKNLDNAWPVPIKFSHVYNLMKTTSYTTDMFREAFRSFSSAIANTKCDVNFIDCNELNSYWDKNNFVFDVPEMGIILNPAIEDHSEVIEELANRFSMYLHQIYEKNSGTKKTTIENNDAKPTEKDLETIKDEVKNLIFRVPYLYEDNVELYFKKMMDSNTSLEINNYVFLMIVDLNKFAQSFITVPELKQFINGVEDDTDVDDQLKLVRNLSKVVFAIQSMHQIKSDGNSASETSYDDAFQLWENEVWLDVRTNCNEESVCTSHKMLFTKNYPSGMEECIKRAQEGEFPSVEEIKEGIVADVDTENRTIPHITDLVMLLNEDRFPDLDTDIETIEKMKEHFIMQYPKVDEFTIEEVEELKDVELTRKILDEAKANQIKKMTEKAFTHPELETLVRYIRDNNGSEDDIKHTETLIDFIKEKREIGVSAQELKSTFYHQFTLDFVQLLKFLMETNIVLRTGISSIVYVHHEYQSEWLTETFVLTSKEKEIFESKQKQEIQKNFKSLLGDLQSSEPRKVQLKPWTKLDGFINDEVFHEWLCIVLSRCVDFPNIPFVVLCEQLHYIKPVDVFYLLEVLQELGCVKIYLLKAVDNILFSMRSVVDECEATCLDDFEEMFVKPTNVAGLCFGSFLDKDF